MRINVRVVTVRLSALKMKLMIIENALINYITLDQFSCAQVVESLYLDQLEKCLKIYVMKISLLTFNIPQNKKSCTI